MICPTKHNIKEPVLICAVSCVLILLVALQLAWLNQSRNLLCEQFDQNVSQAIGNTLTSFNHKYDTDLELSEFTTCGPTENCKYIEIGQDRLNDGSVSYLGSQLSCSLSCYGMSDDYDLKLMDADSEPIVDLTLFNCSANNTLPKLEEEAYILGVSFTTRNEYIMRQMGWMIASMIAVFLLLAFVLFYILNSLIRQRRITENNIDFFNNTAHELKTPLTNISLALRLLRKKHMSLATNKYAQIINDENEKLASQIERVLYLSRMENGQYTLKKEPLVLQNLLQEVVGHLSLILEEKEGQIHLNLPETECTVEGDPFHLKNVFRNLIDNALKYNINKPFIHITLEEVEEGFRLIFEDNGIGINKQDQEHIFEKFQRVNTGDIREAKGFGIGLSYVKKVVEMHHGIIKVLSELNKGSQFEVFIPTK